MLRLLLEPEGQVRNCTDWKSNPEKGWTSKGTGNQIKSIKERDKVLRYKKGTV